VAAALETAAQAAASRGAPEAAADLWEQARQLTPIALEDEARRRSVASAANAFAAGDSMRARVLLDEVIANSPPSSVRADALRVLGEVRFQTDSCPEGTRHLLQALVESGDSCALRAAIELDLAFTLVGLADMRRALEHARAALGLAERLDDDGLVAQTLAVVVVVDFF
jgi:hypothetical protein